MTFAPTQNLPRKPVAMFFLVLAVSGLLFVTVLATAWDSTEWAPTVAAACLAVFTVLVSLAGVLGNRSSNANFARAASVVVVLLALLAIVIVVTNFRSELGFADWIGAVGFGAGALVSVVFDRSFA